MCMMESIMLIFRGCLLHPLSALPTSRLCELRDIVDHIIYLSIQENHLLP